MSIWYLKLLDWNFLFVNSYFLEYPFLKFFFLKLNKKIIFLEKFLWLPEFPAFSVHETFVCLKYASLVHEHFYDFLESLDFLEFFGFAGISWSLMDFKGFLEVLDFWISWIYWFSANSLISLISEFNPQINFIHNFSSHLVIFSETLLTISEFWHFSEKFLKMLCHCHNL